MKKQIKNILIFILGNVLYYFNPILKKSNEYASKLRLTKENRNRKDLFFHGKVHITDPYQIHLGSNVHIGDGAFIRSEGGVKVGDNTHISRNLTLYSVNHDYEGKRLPYDETYIKRSVTIGKNVWIGMDVCITPGVTIGDGAIIGMGTVVSKDVGTYDIIGGKGFRILKERNIEHYKALEEKMSYGGVGGHAIRSNKSL